jgi:hypothetical protein
MPIRVVQKAGKPIGQGEDIVRSIGTGLTEGAASLFGGVGDLQQMAQGAADFIYNKATGGKGAAPKLETPLLMRLPGLAATKAAETAGVDPRVARLAAAVANPTALREAPTSKEIQGAVTKDKPLYQPQTRAGKFARTTAQFAPGAIMPGSVPQRVGNVVVPGVLSEGAGQLTEGTPLEPYARIGGALAGSGAVQAIASPRPDTRLLAEAARGATDDQITAARGLMEQAQQRGVRLTMAEALQQVTNGATGMGRLQRVIEGTEGGSSRLAPVMAERPQQVRQAVTQLADNIAPATDNPYMGARVAQEAASGTLNNVRQAINANARPFYEALQTEVMPPTPAWDAVRQRPEYQIALQEIRNDPVLNRELAALPDDSLAVVDNVVQHLDTLAENARPNPAASTGNAKLSSAYEAVRNQVDELASAYSEPWRLARGMVASQREAFLEPLQAGPLGAISQTGKPTSQTGALFPNQPVEGAAAATGQALEMLPNEVSRGLVRQQIMTGFNEAAQDLSTGPNQWGGAGWAARQFGNAEQAATMRAGLEAATGGSDDLTSLVEVLRATGRRQAPGSLTAYNKMDLERLGEAGAIGEVARTGLNPPGTFRRIGQALQNWQTETNAGRLADAILASPAEAEAILRRAREVVPAGAQLEAIERLALSAQLSQQRQLEAQ